MAKIKKTVYFISDGTGLTAEALGHSLLTQFENLEFQTKTVPYVNNMSKAKQTAQEINQSSYKEHNRPLVFTTLLDPKIYQIISHSHCYHVDFFQTFTEPLEKELGQHSSFTMGRTHGLGSYQNYMQRMNAINYALTNDDGSNLNDYPRADIIITGVSRCGKTPTCIYLAMQFGIYAANYPLTDEDFTNQDFPRILLEHKHKLIGFIIDPKRLTQIRQERRPNSRYASLAVCQREVAQSKQFFARSHIKTIDTSIHSIEEISAQILETGLVKRRF